MELLIITTSIFVTYSLSVYVFLKVISNYRKDIEQQQVYITGLINSVQFKVPIEPVGPVSNNNSSVHMDDETLALLEELKRARETA